MCGKFFKRIFSPVTVCFFLFPLIFSSCGLETLYYLEPPEKCVKVNLGNTDRSLDYFKFQTGDNSKVGDGFTFYGTYVYYRIFYSENEAKDSITKIESYNSSSDISKAASYLYFDSGYSPLMVKEKSESPFISENDVFVEIRLNSYGVEYPKGVKVGGTIHTPRRFYVSGSRYVGFEFSRDDLDNPLPNNLDDDVGIKNGSTANGEWYVDAWAFSYGRDTSYTPSFSKAVHLGSIRIREEWYKN